MRNITKDEAIRLHRQMWSDMRDDLGDCPTAISRIAYKQEWCKKHGYDDVTSSCFLCEYVVQEKRRTGILRYCATCPIKWPGRDCEKGRVNYKFSPISDILELPERKK